MIRELTNHLWQSTLFALAPVLLTLALRNNRANIRYWLWFSASCKFLIPFALLTTLGTHLPHPAITQTIAPPITIEQIAEPFPDTAPPSPSTPQPHNWTPTALLLLWTAGFTTIAALRLRDWRRIRTAVRASTPIPLPAPIEIRTAPGLLEPGVVGLLRPILLLPGGIQHLLTPPQLEAVMAHELTHVRRRDNLFSSIHMLVEAIFWFHPLVWWIGARLIEERERACDEAVLILGNPPRVYAEAILNVCKLYTESPLVCISGVTGSNIRKRIEDIMTRRTALNLTLAKKSILALTATAALALPIAIGILHAPTVRAQSAGPRFQSASIKACTADEVPPPPTHGKSRRTGEGSVTASDGKLDAECQLTASLIREAYLRFANATDAQRLPYISKRLLRQSLPGPEWIASYRYSVHAIAPGTQTPEMMRGPMMQALLEDRFKLKTHRETREYPVYELTVAESGPILRASQKGSCVIFDRQAALAIDASTGKLLTKVCGAFSGDDLYGTTMPALCGQFSALLDRDVIDKTGIAGAFDIHLDSFGEKLHPGGPAASPTRTTPETKFAAARAALAKLGLKLEPAKGLVDFLVIDSVEKPADH